MIEQQLLLLVQQQFGAWPTWLQTHRSCGRLQCSLPTATHQQQVSTPFV
jgi:hypothetical protein